MFKYALVQLLEYESFWGGVQVVQSQKQNLTSRLCTFFLKHPFFFFFFVLFLVDIADIQLTCFVWIYMVSPKETGSDVEHNFKIVILGSVKTILSNVNWWRFLGQQASVVLVRAEFPNVSGIITVSEQVWCLNVKGWGFGLLVENRDVWSQWKSCSDFIACNFSNAI